MSLRPKDATNKTAVKDAFQTDAKGRSMSVSPWWLSKAVTMEVPCCRTNGAYLLC